MGCSSCGRNTCNCPFGIDRFGGRRRENRCTREFRRLLRDLRGGGFNTSITIRGAEFEDLKVISFEDDVVFTVDEAGLARAFCIERIDAIDF